MDGDGFSPLFLTGLLAEKASVFIPIDEFQECLQGWNIRLGIVAVPLEVGSLPVHPPGLPCFHERGLRNCLLELFTRVAPERTNLEYLDALPLQSIPEIKLFAKMWRRPALVDKGPHLLFILLLFKFA